MNVDLVGSLTWLNDAPPKAQANNTGFFLADVQGSASRPNYDGIIAVNLKIGNQTAGDTNSTLALRILQSTTNNISNAVNYTPAAGSSSVSTTNNVATSGQIRVDTRNCYRYLFVGATITGANSPSYPVSVDAVAVAQVQPPGGHVAPLLLWLRLPFQAVFIAWVYFAALARPAAARTSMTDRVIRRCRSIGWYGSVLAPSAIGSQR